MANEYSVFNGNIPLYFGSQPSFFNYLQNGMAGLNKYYQYQASNEAFKNERDLAPYRFSATASNLLDQTSRNNAANIIDERRQQALQREDAYGSNLDSIINLWLSNNKDRNVTISYMVSYYNIDQETANEMLNRAITRYNRQLGESKNNNDTINSSNNSSNNNVVNNNANTIQSYNNSSNISPISNYINNTSPSPYGWNTLNNPQSNILGGQFSQMTNQLSNNPYIQNELPYYLRSQTATSTITPSTLIDVNTHPPTPPLYQFSQGAADRMIV